MSRWFSSYRLRALSIAPPSPVFKARLLPCNFLSIGSGFESPWKQQQYHSVKRLPKGGLEFCWRGSQTCSFSQESKPSSSRPPPTATFIDLFAGIGGFHEALARLGLRCVYANENNPAAAKTYERNHCSNKGGQQPDDDDDRHNNNPMPRKDEGEGEVSSGGGGGGITRVDQRDIREVVAQHMDDIPPHTVLAAGFPCQPFSSNGLGAGFGCALHGDHLRSQIARVVAARRPPFVLLENVPAFNSVRYRGADLVARGDFAALGYAFHHRVYNAADLGLPQNRQRIFMVAVREDLDRDGQSGGAGSGFVMPDPPAPRRPGLGLHECLLTPEEMRRPENVQGPTTYKEFEVVDGGVRVPVRDSYRRVRLDWTDLHTTPDLKSRSRGLIHVGSWEDPKGDHKVYKGEIILHPKGLARCLLASASGWYLAPGPPDGQAVVRVLYPREMARIQGFPESFVLPESRFQALRQLGNAVPPPMAGWSVQALMKHYPGVFSGTPSSSKKPLSAKL